MKSDLQKLVDAWTKLSFIHESRTIEVRYSPVAHGELLIILKMLVTIRVGSRQETVSCNKQFYTQENNSLDTLSGGDCYRFHRVGTAIDAEI